MKISKLFHWLYAILMLLPVFAVGIKCGYVIFNKNANDSYTGNYRYHATTSINEIVSRNNLTYQTLESNLYYIESDSFVNNIVFNITNRNAASTYRGDYLFNIENLYIEDTYYPNARSIIINNTGNSVYARVYDISFDSTNYILHQSNYNLYIRDRNTSSDIIPLFVGNIYNRNLSMKITDNRFYFTVTNYNLTYLLNNTISIFYVDTTLSSVFYSSLQELDNVSFFSWAKNSFLAQPFMYIGNLFGIPNVHPIFTFLSYWMAISVIWLVFDLFIYVPLLCHRWIDKGIKE